MITLQKEHQLKALVIANKIDLPEHTLDRIRTIKSLVQVFGLRGKSNMYIGEAI